MYQSFMGPQELKTCIQGILPVQIFAIANMVIHIGYEFRLDVGKHHLPHGKVYDNVVPCPDSPLGTNRAIRTTANHKPLLSDSFDHGHGQNSRWITDFQGAVDIKTDQDHDVGAFLRMGEQCCKGTAARATRGQPAGRPYGCVRCGGSKGIALVP